MPDQRSAQWYGGNDRNGYIHRAWMRRGLPAHAFDGRPHIAIANTASDLTPCNCASGRGGTQRRAGRVRGGRSPAEPAGGVAGRDAGAADRDVVAQPGRDGHRGDAAREPDRRRGAARRLRQDDPGAAHGCGVGRPAGRRGARRPDAHRHVPGAAARLRHRRLAAVGGDPCGDPVGRAVPALGIVDDPQPRALQHDGDGVDDGPARRGARHRAAGPGRDAGTGQPVARGRARHRTARRRAGRRTAHPVAAAHPRVVPQRDRHPRRDRRIDQRRRAPAGDRRPARHRVRPRRHRPNRRRRPAARRPATRGPAPDGGLLPRRRAARGAGAGARPARPDSAHRDRTSARRRDRRDRHLGRRGDPHP